MSQERTEKLNSEITPLVWSCLEEKLITYCVRSNWHDAIRKKLGKEIDRILSKVRISNPANWEWSINVEVESFLMEETAYIQNLLKQEPTDTRH